MIADGTYDVLVVDATAGEGTQLRVEVTVLGGPHKGDVLAIGVDGLQRDPLDLLAAPGTLVVRDGAPELTLED